MKRKVVIVGAGFSGLAAAYELLKNGFQPVIIEKEILPGGMASCFRQDNFWIEKFYHHFFTHDTEVISLVHELDKENELLWSKCKMGYFSNSTLYSFTTPMDLMKFKEVSLLDRLRFGLFSLTAGKAAELNKLDTLSAEEWLQETIGSQGYKKIIEPLIQSKFGLYMSDISAAFLKGRMKARTQSRSKSMSHEMFGYYRGGLQNFISVMSTEIIKLGGIIRLETEVKSLLSRQDFSFTVKTSRNESIECAYVIITVPVPVLEDIMEPFVDQPLRNTFDYRAAICICAGVEQNLSDYYWINIASDTIPFGVIVEHTNLVDSSFYNGNKILYVSGYYDTSSIFWGMNDDEIVDSFTEGVTHIFPHFSKNKIRWSRVAREQFATPVFRKNFQKSVHVLESRLPAGIYLAGNLLTYPMSRNVNNVIRSGQRAVQKMLSSL